VSGSILHAYPPDTSPSPAGVQLVQARADAEAARVEGLDRWVHRSALLGGGGGGHSADATKAALLSRSRALPRGIWRPKEVPQVPGGRAGESKGGSGRRRAVERAHERQQQRASKSHPRTDDVIGQCDNEQRDAAATRRTGSDSGCSSWAILPRPGSSCCVVIVVLPCL